MGDTASHMLSKCRRRDNWEVIKNRLHEVSKELVTKLQTNINFVNYFTFSFRG